MAMYRKLPVEVEARQFEGGAANAAPLIDWMLASGCTATWSEAYEAWESEDGAMSHPARPEGITIRTIAGDMSVPPGDYIIRGVAGEFYPCRRDIFEVTYEPANGAVTSAAPFTLWCEMRAPGRSVRSDSDWTERATREAIGAVLEVWAHHPDAVGREHGDPVVTIAQSLFFEDTVGIVATLSEVAAQ